MIMKNKADPAVPQSMRVRFPVRGIRNHVMILLQIANAIPISTSIPVDEEGRPAEIKKYGPFPIKVAPIIWFSALQYMMIRVRRMLSLLKSSTKDADWASLARARSSSTSHSIAVSCVVTSVPFGESRIRALRAFSGDPCRTRWKGDSGMMEKRRSIRPGQTHPAAKRTWDRSYYY